jgi:hypothetical protein
MRLLRTVLWYVAFGVGVSAGGAVLFSLAMPVLESPPFPFKRVPPRGEMWESLRDPGFEQPSDMRFVYCSIKEQSESCRMLDHTTIPWISYYTAAGYPFRCLEARRTQMFTAGAPTRVLVHGGFHFDAGRRLFPLMPGVYDDFVPLAPIWAGLLGNAVFYGGIAAVLREGMLGLRRGYRRWRKRCVRCGYPVVAAGVCPECGAAEAG